MHSFPSHYTLEIDVDDLVQTHPDDDWIRFQSEIHRTHIKIPATEAEPEIKVDTRFICFRIDNITGEPTIYGTMGAGRPVYAEALEAAPASWAAPANYCDDKHFTLLTEERMIGGLMERAIEDLGDYGVKADIIRLRNLEADKCKLALCLISSASGTARGEVFNGPTDWLGSRDPMTPVRYTRGSSTGLDD
jgi:hypothetical protein